MGACNGQHTPTLTHLELEAEDLDLDDLDLGEYEGPPQPSSDMVLYTVSLSIAKGSENDALAAVLRSFPGTHAQLFYRPAGVSNFAGALFHERAQKRLRADLARILEGTVPPNTSRETAAPT